MVRGDRQVLNTKSLILQSVRDFFYACEKFRVVSLEALRGLAQNCLWQFIKYFLNPAGSGRIPESLRDSSSTSCTSVAGSGRIRDFLHMLRKFWSPAYFDWRYGAEPLRGLHQDHL